MTPRCLLPVLSVFLVQAAVTQAGLEYFVAEGGSDGDTGLTRSNGWATIQHAVDNITTGDTITVLEGTYDGFWINWSGASNAYNTVRAAPDANVIVNGLPPVSSIYHKNCFIVLDNQWPWPERPVGYWRVEGFEVSGAPSHGILAKGLPWLFLNDIEIRNNKVHDNFYDGIAVWFVDNAVIENNACYTNGYGAGRGEHGIYFGNSGDRPVIRGNHLYNNGGSGLHINADASIGGDGICSDVVIERNVIHNNGHIGGSGINLDGVDGGRVVNNLIYNEHASGISIFQGNGAVPSRNLLVAHNTVVLADNGRWVLNIPNAGSTSNRIHNNILFNLHPTHGSIVLGDTNVAGTISDHNVLMNGFSTDGDSTTIDLDSWHALGYDHHSIIVPHLSGFKDAASGDYRLNEKAPGVDDGIVLPEVSTDILGAPRSRGCGPDIGCYEWGVPGLLMIVTESKAEPLRPLGLARGVSDRGQARSSMPVSVPSAAAGI